MDHGSDESWEGTFSTNPSSSAYLDVWLDIPYIFGSACSTNNMWQGGKYAFGPTLMKRGAIAYVGSVGVAYGNTCEYNAIKEFTRNPGMSLGDMTKFLVMDFCPFYTKEYILLGDPLLEPTYSEVTWE
jgi:hypothetical protein